MNLVPHLHSSLVSGRRCGRLASALARLIPSDHEITGLDIGCGPGVLSQMIMSSNKNIRMSGVEVLIRPDPSIPVTEYDGQKLPFTDQSFDFCMLIDVLHHTQNLQVVLREAVRVARQFVLIKDHYCQGAIDRLTLKFMDWVGNRYWGVALPYNYLSREKWVSLFQSCHLSPELCNESLNLFPFPTSLVFERQLHFIAKLQKMRN
jgi:SAM-dependent methyltransferase